MAASMGKDGSVKIGGSAIALDSWTLTPGFNTAEITKYGDSTVVNAATLKTWSAECGATLDMADAQQAALLGQFSGTQSNVSVEMYIDSTHYWSGSAVCTAAPVTSTVGDKVSVSFSFVSAGDLSYT